jgi:hypothetical protein
MTNLRRVALCTLALLLLATPAVYWRIRSGANLTVINNTAATLQNARVSITGSQFDLGSLAPGQRKTVKARRYSDSDWSILGKWSDGAPFETRFGYITHGASFDDTLVIAPDRTTNHHSTMWHFLPPSTSTK